MRIKIIVLIILSSLLNTLSYAQISLFHWVATWANVTMNFDATSPNPVWIDLDSFTGNACGTDHKGFLLTWEVNREGNWYVYFSEDDWDDAVDSCVAVVLSWKDFILTGVGATDSWTGYKMLFNNIKLIYNKNDKVYYFSWEAIDDALWSVPNWQDVYVSWLNLIDWSKTIVDYSALTGGNYYANWNSTGINVILKDVAWNPVNILDSIDVEISSSNSSLSWLVFLSWDSVTWVKLTVDNWIVNIPVYILKAVNNGEISLKFTYDISDIDGNNTHTLILTGINVKQPVSNINLYLEWESIVWENFTGNLYVSYVSKWTINNISITWSISTTSAYSLDLLSSSNTWFVAKVYPKNPNNTISKVDSTYQVSSYQVGFSNFTGVQVSYSYDKKLNFASYADKRIDLTKSFTGLVLNQEFTWADLGQTLSFKPVLRDKNWYVIPDIKFDIKIKDNGQANSYTWWDCDELDAGYQTNCKALQFIYDGKVYSWNLDWVLWQKITYKTNGYSYPDIKVVSFKPVTGASLKFEITNLKNTSSDWNFANSGNWINLPDWYDGLIKNIVFQPFLKLRLVGLDDENNYVDINNDINFRLQNTSSYKLITSYHLVWEITKPKSGAKFDKWSLLTWENVAVFAWSKKDLLQTILFSLAYLYDKDIKFNYNHGYYTYKINGIGSLKLVPWSFYFNLGWTYKIWGSFINWLVNKAQKYSSSIKTVLWRQNHSISAKFSNVYNALRKKVNYIVQGLSSETSNKLDPDDLKGGIKYYDCRDWPNKIVEVTTGTYQGVNTIILNWCKLLINGNIYKDPDNPLSNLVFFLFDDKSINLGTPHYLDRISNIYIAEHVSDIEAGLFTKGSILTIDDDIASKDPINKVWIHDRVHKINARQLYIHGSLMAQNNVGWSFLVLWENKFTIWGDKKILTNSLFWWKKDITDLRDIAQIFDINFWRWFKYSGPNTIDPNWYSDYCKSHTSEQWCKYPVYIQFDPSIRNNILFR